MQIKELTVGPVATCCYILSQENAKECIVIDPGAEPDRILKAAAKHKIPYQMTTGHRATGGTDTAAIQMTRGGVATALISIPNRYMHTPAEICDLRDVENAIKLIAETIASFSGKETFIPGID